MSQKKTSKIGVRYIEGKMAALVKRGKHFCVVPDKVFAEFTDGGKASKVSFCGIILLPESIVARLEE